MTNRQLEKIISDNKIQNMRVGYEELCFYTPAILKKVCDFIGINLNKNMLDLNESTGHIGTGNPMRSDNKKSKKIYYDQAWFTDDMINLLYLMRPRIRDYNKKRVYSNLTNRQKEKIVFTPI
jgi:hypothetical protein